MSQQVKRCWFNFTVSCSANIVLLNDGATINGLRVEIDKAGFRDMTTGVCIPDVGNLLPTVLHAARDALLTYMLDLSAANPQKTRVVPVVAGKTLTPAEESEREASLKAQLNQLLKDEER